MTTTGKATAGCLSMAIAAPFAILLNGYALSVLWAWFMVPVFHLPEIGIAQASGISLVVGMMTHQVTPVDKEREWWEEPITILGRPLIALLLGAIWKSFL